MPSFSDSELEARGRALTHWTVVFVPGDYATTVPRVYDDGTECATAREAAERAYGELADAIEEGARNGAAPLEELEVLVYERGNETERFLARVAWDEQGASPPSDWRPREEDAQRVRDQR